MKVMKLKDYKDMSEDECGYCKICGEKTLKCCTDDSSNKIIPICEDCAKEYKLKED
jgi:hypothetical protein